MGRAVLQESDIFSSSTCVMTSTRRSTRLIWAKKIRWKGILSLVGCGSLCSPLPAFRVTEFVSKSFDDMNHGRTVEDSLKALDLQR